MQMWAALITVAFVTPASGGPVSPQDSQRSSFEGAEVSCVLNGTCSLPCPFEGQLEKAHWVRVDKFNIPIAVWPLDREEPLRHDFRNISSLSLEQPGDGAVLRLRRVQKHHEGVYQCYLLLASSGGSYHRVLLTVHGLFVKSITIKKEKNERKKSKDYTEAELDALESVRQKDTAINLRRTVMKERSRKRIDPSAVTPNGKHNGRWTRDFDEKPRV
ncbi:hypothetical protein WMY93_029618 [Mugilogobius chulae]|uniref:Ig-like domain-containing protein n=1 Tax=Mugilogobius chulae TaxID=88201 RepID=A0AAW0MWC2_9GOBI